MRFQNKAELTKWVQQSQPLWLFLDYDGTLADFAPTPNHVESNPEIIALVEHLSYRPATRVTILSGRRLDHTRMLLPVPGIFLAGTYGIELMTPSGETIQRVELTTIRPTLEAVKLQWSEIVGGRKGFFLEDKGWALALHARFAEDKEAEHILTQARQTIDGDSLAGRFRVLGGHKFLEVAPRLASKKETVAYLLSQYPLPKARLLYIGDDDKDEEAFPVIHEQQGVAVKVLQPSQLTSRTEADFFFGSPAETLHWLAGLV
ncbi:MAG TPA: trehalose-phosphatase [Anaerolineales bacterium]|nr:trehalose-phosphatase [Anaerolineales bacterium]